MLQKGYIFRMHGAWHLRYRANGKQFCQRLAPYNDTFRTVKSVRGLADEILLPLNLGRQPGGPQALQSFIEHTYLPFAKQHKRASTYKGYLNLYKRHLADRVAGVKLWEFRTVDAQRLLDAIASSTPLARRSLFNIKTFLSAVFAEAKRLGVLDGINPIQGTRVPKGQPTPATYAYSLDEIKKMVEALDGVCRTAVIVAAWTGLSLGELRGLQWSDIGSGQITVTRTCWEGVVGPTKTTARNAPVPMLPVVSKALAAHHKANPGSTWVFEGPKQFPIGLAKLGTNRIKPALEEAGLRWAGWHAFRRGFATNLHAAGVQDKIIQDLLRHASLAVTMAHYVRALPEQTVAAVQLLGKRGGKAR